MYGLSQLGAIGDYLWSLYVGGWSTEQIMLEMRNTPEYKRRFPAMDSLRQRGRAISEAEYIGLETQYSQILRQYGLPKGFYDDYSDFAGWISGDVSPREIEQRVRQASDLAYQAPQETRAELRRLYGVGEGEIIGYYLDSNRLVATLEKQYRTSQVAGFSLRSGMRQLGLGEAERFAALNPEEIDERIRLYREAAFGQPIETRQELARLYGITDLTGETVNPDRAVALLQQRLTAAQTGGMSLRTGFGQLGVAEAEKLGLVGTSEEEFQYAVSSQPLFGRLLASAEEDIGRGEQIDIIAGSQPAREKLERKRARRKAEFGGGGGYYETQKGVRGLASAR